MEAIYMAVVIFGLVYAVVLIVLPFVVVAMNNKIKTTNEILTSILAELKSAKQ